MHQRDLVKRVWEEAGLYRTRDSELRQFLEHLDESSEECWPELVERARALSSKHLATLVRPLWKSGDKLLRINLIRAADMERGEERELLRRYIRLVSPEQDEFELRAVLEKDSVEVVDQILRKRNLTPQLRTLAELRRAQLRV